MQTRVPRPPLPDPGISAAIHLPLAEVEGNVPAVKDLAVGQPARVMHLRIETQGFQNKVR
jgi:hypothetical protein